MKSKFLLLVSLVLSLNLLAQNCPVLETLTVEPITNSPCAASVKVILTNDANPQKGFNVLVFSGTGTSGTLISNNCFIVPGNSTVAFNTTPFSCTGVITIVTSGRTSSNGDCQGGFCTGDTTRASGTPGVVLPVSLTSFTANRNSSVVSLKWNSELEINLKEYLVEMNDGNGFKTIGTVAARNNGVANSYSFEKSFSSKQSVQYRLKMVDFDGKFANSKTALVKGDNQSLDFNIYPNPSTSANTNILIAGYTNSSRITVTDMAGRVLKTLAVNSNNMHLGKLPNGIFMVKLFNPATAEQVTKRLVIVN